MTEFQVTRWRELPSMVAAREGEQQVRAMLAERFQGAIDEAAMRLGEGSSDDYLAGWSRDPWTEADGSPDDVVARVSAELAEQWPQQALTDFLDALGSTVGSES